MRVNLSILLLALFSFSCTDLYEQPLPDYESELVIEAYVNQQNPLLNYALITKSLAYYDEDFNVEGVKDVVVTLFEGEKIGTELIWDDEGLVYEAFDEIEGLYLAPLATLFTAKEGFYYKLVVQYENETATAVTKVPKLVPMDSIWVDKLFNPSRDTLEPYLKFAFKDPEAFGNYYMVADFRNAPTEWPLLWGAVDRIVVTDDLLFNNQPFTYSQIFPDQFGDTVNMYLISIDKPAFEYWQSYEASRGNGGPFSQPINVTSTFDNARGIFQGMAVDVKRIIIE